MSKNIIARPSIVAPVGLAAGFTVAQKTGRREAGGAIFGVAGILCFWRWYKELGLVPALVLTLIYVNAMGVSHPLAKKIGAWPAVGVAAAGVAVASEVATRRGSSKVAKVTGVAPVDAVLANLPVESVVAGLQQRADSVRDRLPEAPLASVREQVQSLPLEQVVGKVPSLRLSDLPVDGMKGTVRSASDTARSATLGAGRSGKQAARQASQGAKVASRQARRQARVALRRAQSNVQRLQDR